MAHLTQTQLEFFAVNGYLVVEDVLDEADLRPLWAEYSAILDWVAPKFLAEGRICSSYDHLPFDQRYMAIMAEAPELIDYVEITLPLVNSQISLETTPNHGPGIFGLLTNPKLLDVVESVLGPEVSSNPVQHVRLKPPMRAVRQEVAENSYVGKTTWHQDLAGLLDEADETQVLTTWVAITDAPLDRGPLCVIPGSHRKGGLTTHCMGKDVQVENFIPAKLLGDDLGNKTVVPLPVRRGGVVLLNCFTEHAALSNTSTELRWSFDLRWHPTGQPSGRPAFPEFVARSRSNPAQELRDPAIWQQMWMAAKAQIIAGQYEGDIYNMARLEAFANSPVCA
ncbi:MAG: phytanoyl-CoA dioxygenase family protein [Ardenticatenaceae bacterium]|nr:phytanoyl-CoA dioxygenase family protein [Anaerolineales bacterium]MCB9432516.1 phytanoyl-CoA dioxygenase family protein [Ardenticatenaceae bacterium]